MSGIYLEKVQLFGVMAGLSGIARSVGCWLVIYSEVAVASSARGDDDDALQASSIVFPFLAVWVGLVHSQIGLGVGVL